MTTRTGPASSPKPTPESKPSSRSDMENFDPLVTTSWLEGHLHDGDVRVVDIRGYVKKTDLGDGRQEAEYLAAPGEYYDAHIPGAVYVDWTIDITDPDDPVPAQVALPDRFAAVMGSLGIGDDTHVVVYDHTGGQFATRLWWALTFYGHDRVSVLDGGWAKWTAEGRPTTTEVPVPEPAIFTPEPRSGWRKEPDDLLAAGDEGLVLDSRDEGQYTGDVVRGEGRGGHVPGAVHLHSDGLFDPESGTFLPDEALARRLGEAGVTEDRDEAVVAYCNGGGCAP